MNFELALKKLVTALDREEIEYMLVGGYAMSFYNRYRFTADIDCVLLIHPHQVSKLVKHFPEWGFAAEDFENSAKELGFFNLTDFESGIRLDFILFSVTDYNWTAYQRKKQVVTDEGTECYISSPEDLVIAKLKWAQTSGSQRQLDDIKFLVDNLDLNMEYLKVWTSRLLINTYGLF